MNKPVVSFIIPCHNAAGVLPRCLASILAQNLADYEIIVVDDGSSDGVKAVAERALAGANWQFCRHEKCQGVSVARNDGLDMARGEFVMFVDADDALKPGAAAHLLGRQEQYGADFCVGNADCVSSKGEFLRLYSRHESGVSVFSMKDGLSVFLKNQSIFDTIWGKLYRRSMLERGQVRFAVGLPFSEDTLFAYASALAADRIVVDLNFSGYMYYQNDSSCVHTIDYSLRYQSLDRFLTCLSGICGVGEGRQIMLRKAKEYLWSIKKLDAKIRYPILREKVQGATFRDIIAPVIRQHGKFKHRVLVACLQHGIFPAIHFW